MPCSCTTENETDKNQCPIAAAANLQQGLRVKWRGRHLQKTRGTLAVRLSTQQEEWGLCQIIGYHRPVGFYQRLWKGAGAGRGKRGKGKGKREDEAEVNLLQPVNFLFVSSVPTHRILPRMERDNICKIFIRVQNQKPKASLMRGFLYFQINK